MTTMTDLPLFMGPGSGEVLPPAAPATDSFAARVEQESGEPYMVSQACEVCGEVLTGKNKGPGSLTFKLGTHRRVKHNIAGKGKAARRKAGAPTPEDYEAHPVTSAIRDVAAEIGGKGTPNTEQLTAGLGRLIGLSTYTAASWAIETDKTLPPNIDRDQAVEYLSLSEADAKALMHPVARMLAPTKVNAKYGRAVVDNVDLVGAIAGLAQLGWHWTEYLKARREGNALLRAQLTGERQLAAVPQPTQMQSPIPPPPDPGAMPSTGTGYVVTAADVERFRAAKASA